MKLATPAKFLLSSALLCLLSACSSDVPKPAEPVAPAKIIKEEQPTALPAHLRELSGSLLNVPAAAEVEMALLAVDQRGRPRTLLGDIRLRGTGNPLPFNLRFNPEAFGQFQRVELRARVNQSGRLILRLPPKTIAQPESQVLGALTLVPAP
ncbi:YbaY family lipoprotein [Ectopseudomonas mendocina]|uniref:YbaY family lipoprotein n=1 Tax=Ectopseudomonas mendocina TaxID=300 RepID=A0ABZ2RLQ2_ECTME